MYDTVHALHDIIPFSNELLWLLFALVNFGFVLLIYKLFGKTGMFAWIAFASVLLNIQVTKTIELFGITATLGNVMFGSIFLVTDALNEKYGLVNAKRAVYIGFFSIISMAVIMQAAIWFAPAPKDFAHESLVTIFEVVPRLVLGSILAYIISQLIDVHLFQRIKKRFASNRTLYVRNLGSTLFSQLIDTAIFVPIAFLGIHATPELISIWLTTYIIKVLVAFLDTPFVYLIKQVRPISWNDE